MNIMKSKLMKRIISITLCMAMVAAISLPLSMGAVSAADDNLQSIIVEGITYNTQEYINGDGNKEVIVTANGETTVVIKSGNDLIISETNVDGVVRESLISLNFDVITPSLRQPSSGGGSTPFWNYSYQWSDVNESIYGLFWTLSSGDSTGSMAAYDNNNFTARGYAESFMQDVGNIASQQNAAIGSLGLTLASVIAAGITAATGGGAVIGIVLALGGTAAAGAFFFSAHSASLNANYNFGRFKSTLGY